MEKMTYVKALEIAINANISSEVNEKLTQLLNQLAKKSSAERKPTKTQNANNLLTNVIFASMEINRAYTVTELIKEIPELAEMSNQKVSALVRMLKDEGRVKREEIKGKSYFTRVENED